MVKDNTGSSVNLKLGLLSVSVDDLLEILRRKGISRIHAESGTFEFDSLEDMGANLGLLSGYPLITCDGVRLELGKYSREVRSYGDRDSTVLARSIYADLMQRRGLLEKYAELPIFSSYIFFPIAVFNMSFPFLPDGWVLDRDIGNWLVNIAFLYMILYMFKIGADFYCRFRRPAVRYVPKEGFVSRHAETIIVSAITAVLGAFAGPLVLWVTKLIELD